MQHWASHELKLLKCYQTKCLARLLAMWRNWSKDCNKSLLLIINGLGYLTSGLSARAAWAGIPTRRPLVNLSAGHVLLIYAPRHRKPEWWIVLDEGSESGETPASAHQAIRLSPSVPPSISQVCITSRSGAEGQCVGLESPTCQFQLGGWHSRSGAAASPRRRTSNVGTLALVLPNAESSRPAMTNGNLRINTRAQTEGANERGYGQRVGVRRKSAESLFQQCQTCPFH